MNSKEIYCLIFAIIVAFLVLIWGINVKSLNDVEEPSEPVKTLTPAPPSEPIPQLEIEPEETYNFYDIPFDLETQKEIITICSEYDISYELVLGVISVESAFRADVIGDGGNSFGLMQIQPRWWRKTMDREGVTDLLDPLQNIRCGCAILRELINKFDTEYRALQAYNTGRPYTTNGYADKVYRHIEKLTIYGG